MQPKDPIPRRRRMNAVRLVLLLVCALAVACSPMGGRSAAPSPSPVVSAAGPPRGVVAGTITAGPVCPVESSPPDPQCAPRPVAGAVVVATDAGGQELGRVTSAADGSYVLPVGEAGTVLITALPIPGLARAPEPVSVTVDSPIMAERVDLEYDTGIR